MDDGLSSCDSDSSSTSNSSSNSSSLSSTSSSARSSDSQLTNHIVDVIVDMKDTPQEGETVPIIVTPRKVKSIFSPENSPSEQENNKQILKSEKLTGNMFEEKSQLLVRKESYSVNKSKSQSTLPKLLTETSIDKVSPRSRIDKQESIIEPRAIKQSDSPPTFNSTVTKQTIENYSANYFKHSLDMLFKPDLPTKVKESKTCSQLSSKSFDQPKPKKRTSDSTTKQCFVTLEEIRKPLTKTNSNQVPKKEPRDDLKPKNTKSTVKIASVPKNDNVVLDEQLKYLKSNECKSSNVDIVEQEVCKADLPRKQNKPSMKMGTLKTRGKSHGAELSSSSSSSQQVFSFSSSASDTDTINPKILNKSPSKRKTEKSSSRIVATSRDAISSKRSHKRKFHQPELPASEPVLVKLDSDGATGTTKRTTRTQTFLAAPRVSLHMLGGASSESECSQLDPVRVRTVVKQEKESATCSVLGCDSSGHLGGLLKHHFTRAACPLYHNKDKQTCERMYHERQDENIRHDNAMQSLEASNSLTDEQRSYRAKVATLLMKNKPDLDVTTNETDRQPCLANVTSDYELRMFEFAQAAASEQSTCRTINIGKSRIIAPYHPADMTSLYVCPFCFKFLSSTSSLKRHRCKCPWQYPPGNEIYRDDGVSIWMVDGKKSTAYCVNLCSFAKLFLDHKSAIKQVDPFIFYVMTVEEAGGCRAVGYFSKEKKSVENNVSCILVVPDYQRRGYGRLLIDFSYLLSRVEGLTGTPERPLSDLGLVMYRKYWTDVTLDYLCRVREAQEVSIMAISKKTGIDSCDVISTLQAIGMVKYWKGQHIILKKKDVLDEHALRKRFGHKVIDPDKLNMPPYFPRNK